MTNTYSARRDDGSITVLYAIAFVALLMMVGLVADGGRLVDERSHLQDVAAKAARAGAQQLATDTFTSTGTVTLDPGRARAAASSYLSRAGETGTVTVVGATVTVTVSDRVPFTWLRLTGLHARTVEAIASANARTA